MADLFGDDPALFDDLLPVDTVADITHDYCKALLLNPPTPSFNLNTNPKAEAFARKIAPKDVTRFLAVLAGLGLEIAPKRVDAPGHGDS